MTASQHSPIGEIFLRANEKVIKLNVLDITLGVRSFAEYFPLAMYIIYGARKFRLYIIPHFRGGVKGIWHFFKIYSKRG